MKKIKYIVVLTALLLTGGFVRFSTLHAENNDLIFQVMGTLLVKRTPDVNAPAGFSQVAMNELHMRLEYQGRPVMGDGLRLYQRNDEFSEKGEGAYVPPNLSFQLHDTYEGNVVEAGQMVVKGDYVIDVGEMPQRLPAVSNPFSAVVFTDEIVSSMTITKGETKTYSAGTIDCGVLDASECYISYEPEDPDVLRIDENTGEFEGLKVGRTNIITNITIPSINPYTIEVGRTSVSVEEGSTPPAVTTEYTYEPTATSLVEGYTETKLGNVKMVNSDQSTPSLHYYAISDTTKFRIDDAGVVYAKEGMLAGNHDFTITVYKDASKTDIAKTLAQTITVTPADSTEPTPNPDPDNDPTPTPDPDTPSADSSWISLPSIPSSLWYIEPITIHMSNVQSDYTQMSVNGGAYAPSLVFDKDGIHTLEITFKNPTTNEVTSPISVQVKMDQHDPIIEEIKQDPKDDSTFSILASDALSDPSIATSGLDKIKYTIYQVITSTEKTKLEEKEVTAAELVKLSTTATGNIEICASASDHAKRNGEEKCTDFTIASANEPTKKILEAENAAGTIEIDEDIPAGTTFHIEDITKKMESSEVFDDLQQVNLALRMSLSAGSLNTTAKVELPLTKDILTLANKAYYIKGSDGTLKKLDAKIIDDKLVFQTKSMGDVYIVTPKETTPDPTPNPNPKPDSNSDPKPNPKPDTTVQSPGDGEKNEVNGGNGSRNNSGVSTGDGTMMGMYLILAAGAVLSMSFYMHQRRQHK